MIRTGNIIIIKDQVFHTFFVSLHDTIKIIAMIIKETHDWAIDL